jgi:hypothetical protein
MKMKARIRARLAAAGHTAGSRPGGLRLPSPACRPASVAHLAIPSPAWQ